MKDQQIHVHGGRPSRLKRLIDKGFSELSDGERQELEALIDADVAEWREMVGARLQADIAAGHYTKRGIAEAMGMHETFVGRAISDPSKISERMLGLLSVAVPGYEGVYAEFRRRADQLYLPGEPDEADAARMIERLRELNHALQAQLPAAMAALERLNALASEEGDRVV